MGWHFWCAEGSIAISIAAPRGYRKPVKAYLTHNPQWSLGRDVSRPESVQAYQRRHPFINSENGWDRYRVVKRGFRLRTDSDVGCDRALYSPMKGTPVRARIRAPGDVDEPRKNE